MQNVSLLETFWVPAMLGLIMAYRRNLPHFHASGAVYFITWRCRREQASVSEKERYQVVSALRWFEGTRYRLHGYVAMDDHVHVVVEPLDGWRLGQIVHSWKSFTANRFQRLYGRNGSLWQDEYFDRIIRDEQEYQEKLDYILGNPRKRWPDICDYPWVWAIGVE